MSSDNVGHGQQELGRARATLGHRSAHRLRHAARIAVSAGAFALAVSTAFAGEPNPPNPRAFRLGLGLMTAVGLGSMSTDLNGHPGFGFTLQGYLPVASRFRVRPAFEWTGYRVNEYNFAALVLAEMLGATYLDTRVVFRTYRFGVDGVAYFRDRYRGPYLSGGVGVQVSRIYVEDVARHGDDEDVTLLDASSATTGLWVGGGVGYQWEHSNVELRLSRAPYRFTFQRTSGPHPNDLPFEARPGWALHLILAVTS